MRNWLRRFYPNINTRILAPFLVMVIVVAGIGIFIVTRLVAGSIEERLNNQLLDSAQAASNAVVDIERQQLVILRAMAFTEGVDEAITENDVSALTDMLSPIAFNSNLDDAIVFDSEGNVLLRVKGFAYNGIQNRPDPTNISDRRGVQNVLTGQADLLGDKYFDMVETDLGQSLYISAPVYDDDKRLVGGISVGIGARTFVARVSLQSLSGITFYQENGFILGTTLTTVPIGDLTLTPLQLEALFQAMQSSAPIERKLFGGESYQVLYSPLRLRQQEVGLMAVSLPNNFITDRIGTSRNLFGLLFSLLFVGIFLLGLVVSRSIIRPVKRLVQTTQAIREGDLSKRVGLEMPDELGELSATFDDMAEKLIERNQQINQLYISQLGETARRDAILGSINEVVMVFTNQGEEILRNSAADALHQELQVHPASYQRFLEICRQPDMGDGSEIVPLGHRSFSLLTQAVRMESGEQLGYVVVLHDITALLQAERVKDEILLQLSHELRTPLTSAKGYVDLIRMMAQMPDSYDENKNGFALRSSESLTILERMINQVIDLSMITSGRLSLLPTEFNLLDIIQEVIRDLTPAIEAAEQTISTDCTEEKVLIKADRVRIKQVLERVIHNAHVYNRHQGAITIQVENLGEQIAIWIVDSGLGILPEEREKIFERMYRGSAASVGAADSRGLGLGLYIARELIKAHGGRIEIIDSNIFGTRLRIILPQSALS